MAKKNCREKNVYRECGCGCCMLVVSKSIWETGDVDYKPGEYSRLVDELRELENFV
jgi:hypothetical protein